MTSIPLTIVLHGLVALVPTNSQGGTNHMTALLIDARTAMPHTACTEIHHPVLDFVVADTAQCTAAGCRLSGQKCECTDSLADKEVVLDIQPAPTPAPHPPLPVHPAAPLPWSPADANDFGYVPNLSQAPFNATLDRRFLASPPPPLLLARMGFDFESIAACGLFVREDEGVSNVHSMNFRILGTRGRVNEPHQALAQMVVARLTIPDAAAGQQSVTLHLRDFGGAGDHAFLLLPGSQGYRVDLANDTDPLDPDDPCDDGVARHFAHYQDLAENPPLWTNRLLPHVKFTVWKPRGSVTPQDPSQDPCSLPSFHLNDRPACPLASFDAVTTP